MSKDSDFNVQLIQYLAILQKQTSVITQFCIHVESLSKYI